MPGHAPRRDFSGHPVKAHKKVSGKEVWGTVWPWDLHNYRAFANEAGPLATYSIKVRISDGEVISASLTHTEKTPVVS